jgi:hypothetical protein
MLLKKKKSGFKSIQMIEDDIRYGFNKIMSQNERIYHFTISDTHICSVEELRFILTNKIFNSIHKDYKNSFETLNYLFVIEYPEKVSRGNFIPDSCEVHTHIVLSTSLSPEQVNFYIKTTLKKYDVFYERIDNRNDKYNLINYLLKQKELFTDSNYNYKINCN